MATYYKGTSGSVIIGSTNYCVKDWEFTDEAAELDTGNKCSGGFFTGITGRRKGTFSFTATFDADIHEADPSPVKAGTTGAIQLEVEDGGSSISGTGHLTSVSLSHSLEGLCEISAEGFMDGEYYMPGEATS